MAERDQNNELWLLSSAYGAREEGIMESYNRIHEGMQSAPATESSKSCGWAGQRSLHLCTKGYNTGMQYVLEAVMQGCQAHVAGGESRT